MLEIQKKKIWVLWRWETKSDGKRTKVPMSVSGGPCGTDEKWYSTWATYDEAVAAKGRISNAAGIGFIIPEGFYFIDIDSREITDPFVRTILFRHDTYAEYSVSCTGIHLYGKCDFTQIPTYTDKNGKLCLDRQFYQKNPSNKMELYIGGITNRFAVYTGNVIADKPLRESTAAILTTLEKDMRRKPKVKYSEKRDGSKADFDIVRNLRTQKNGEKFSMLFDRGDFSEYNSQSEADAALCAMIAFRTGPDPDAVDEIFRRSALFREKWNRDDYRQNTIAAGIEACHGIYHKSKMAAPYFVKFNDVTGESYISVPLLARYVREHLHYLFVRDNGRQAISKYVYVDGCYRYHDDAMFRGRIKQFIADYDEELVKMGQVAETLNHLTTDINYVTQDNLNGDEDIINFRNGLLRITVDSLQLFPHSPDIYSTIQIPCDWNGTPAPTPVFDQYMNTLTNGDKEIEHLLLEFIGACISNVRGYRMKKSLFMVGNGNTGKSQLKRLVEKLLGAENFIGIDLQDMEVRFGTGAIYGKRLAGSADMSFMSVNELKIFKMITGGDAVFAEFKGMQGFQYTYNGLLWFCMNRLPKFGGDDGQWVYDRIMVVNCPNVIPMEKQDKQLLDKLFAERDGIVFKAVSALQTVIANGYRFSEPASVTDARKEYKSTNSTVISFFVECMCPWQNGKINRHCTTGRIYKVYQAWCQENNNGYAKNAREFREELAAYLDTTFPNMTSRLNGNTYYRDYTLTTETKEQYAQEYGYDDGTDFL